jgi:hypothetical protein
MTRILKLFLVTLISYSQSPGQTKEIKAKGFYKEIDVDRQNKTMEKLNGGNKKNRQLAIDSVLRKPNNYNPPVLYALAKQLFNQDEKKKATFWFYTAQLRARYDANLCMDNSTRQAVSVLNGNTDQTLINMLFKILTAWRRR